MSIVLRFSTLFLILFAMTMPALGQAPDPDKEVILIPIVVGDVELSGGYGSRWSGEVWLRNGTEETLRGGFQLWSEVGCTACTYPPLEVRRVPSIKTWQSAALLRFQRTMIEELTITARMFESSRRSQPQGVEIPVVREKDFFQGPANLLAIPLSAHSRAAVRIFEIFPMITRQRFDIEIYGETGLLVRRTVEPRFDPATLTYGSGIADLPAPAFAIIPDLRTEFSELEGVDLVHVRIVPHERDFPPFRAIYWAMASVTDNETQHVLLVTPRCCSPALEWP